MWWILEFVLQTFSVFYFLNPPGIGIISSIMVDGFLCDMARSESLNPPLK